ncbi:MAG: glycoside hydrolase family 2 protein [Oscillospiraceae bacterium]|nr:glycoside hydrolase family 2 protein [Oscillospiraceae bacterium]
MMDNWIFKGPYGEEMVNLPHTWNAKDGQDGGNNYYRGSCSYSRDFAKPHFEQDQRVYLQFHGVNASAQVILNGTTICTHHNGYSTFRVDITEYLEENNHLEVVADNSKNDRVYPQMADFTFYGGIYREVELLLVNQKHFDLDYYGGSGVRVDTDVQGTKGIVKVKTFTSTDEGDVVLTLSDADGNTVAMVQGTDAVMTVENVHLWDGVRDPYLYTLTAQLVCDGKTVDTVTCRVGIRTFYIDAGKGFFLNGKHYPMRGVSRHQDFKGIGNAISHSQMEDDMDMIREMGATAIRLAHYQHSQHFYDLCDEYGMVVWAEIPYISAHMPNGRENTFLQMQELIVQNYNHPSIVTWGISNEITISSKHKADMLDNHRALQKFVKELDPSRPTTLACYAMCHPFHPVSKITDIVAWNLYLGWYVPGLFLNDLFMKFYHWKYPHRPLGYSEYGAEGMPNLHSSKPKRGDHTEEYQAKYHEYMLDCFERHPFLWGTYVWNMFDFAADAREQGGESGMNHKGLVTFDRKIKKDSFYIYKARWSDEKFVHLCGKRYQYRTENISDVTIYSNMDTVSLYNNGRLVATQKGKYAFRFKVKLEKENRLEAVAGEFTDSAVIFRTDNPRTEYKVKKGKSQNWV